MRCLGNVLPQASVGADDETAPGPAGSRVDGGVPGRALAWYGLCPSSAGSQDWYPGFLLSDFFNLGVFALWCAVLWRSETRRDRPRRLDARLRDGRSRAHGPDAPIPGRGGWSTYLEAGLTVWIAGLGGLVLVRIASGVRRRANVSGRAKHLQRKKADQRISAAPAGRTPAGEAAAADDPIGGGRVRSRRETAVGEPLRLEQRQRVGAAAIADPPQLGHDLQGEENVVELDREVDRSTAPPQSGSISAPSRRRQSSRRERSSSAARRGPSAAVACRRPKAQAAGRDRRLLEGRTRGRRAACRSSSRRRATASRSAARPARRRSFSSPSRTNTRSRCLPSIRSAEPGPPGPVDRLPGGLRCAEKSQSSTRPDQRHERRPRAGSRSGPERPASSAAPAISCTGSGSSRPASRPLSNARAIGDAGIRTRTASSATSCRASPPDAPASSSPAL